MRRTVLHLAIFALVAGLLPAFTAPDLVVEEPAETGRYFVLLADPPLARYEGGIAGIPATAAYVTGERRLNPHSAASRAYLDHLRLQHDALVLTVSSVLGRQVEPVARYDAVLNGLALELSPEEAVTVAALPGVRDVQPDERLELHTDAGPEWIGSDAFWAETPDGLEGVTGEGVVVGIIDTGVNPFHPSFAEVGPVDGHVHENPFGTYFGLCDPITGAPFCNDKLIGMYDFTGSSPVDDHGHGSHVASTVAGNVVDAAMVSPTTTVEARISGVAPHANIISYKACNTGSCLGTIAVDVLNQVVFDPIDVINYSIGGSPQNPWTNIGAQAFFDLTAAGVYIATSAGNSGPGAGTVGSPGNAPWITTVGASTHQRAFLNSLVEIEGGDAPDDIDGKSVSAGYGPGRVVYAGDFGDPLCGAPFPPGTWNGEIVLCDRGINARVEKAQNVGIGGAGGFILANDAPSGEELIADPYPIPGLHVTYADGIVLKDWIEAGGGPDNQGTATITGTLLDVDPGNGDIMAAFSSRGPNSPVPSVIKPDITAPGVDILAAWVPHGDVPDYNVISGTSMSSPHIAGAAALLRALQPEWSPDAVRSALMTTSFTRPPGSGDEVQPVLDDDGETAATPFEYGAGRVDLRAAANAGLIIEESIQGYIDADPANGGDPSAMNIPSMSHDDCVETCSWTRTVTSSASTPVTWETDASGDLRMGISVEPSSFTILPGESQTITVTVDSTYLRPAAWHFGEVTLTPADATVSSVRLPVAVGLPAGDDAEILDLYFHGNEKDGCSGLGAVDAETGYCDGPYLRTDPTLDDTTAAAFGPLAGGVRGGIERNAQDAGWTWYLDEPVTVGGTMGASFWASCVTCEAIYAAEWRVTIWADGQRAFDAGPFLGSLPAPALTGLVEFDVIVPAIRATDRITVQINPYYDDMQGVFVYYDSTSPCPGAVGSDPCNSFVRMPVVAGPDLTVESLEVRETTAQQRIGPGDRARIVATVRNIGTAEAPSASQTEFRLVSGGETIQTSRVTTQALAAGASQAVEFSLDTRGLRGDYTIVVEANADWDFWELTTTNTVASLDVTIHGNRVEIR